MALHLVDLSSSLRCFRLYGTAPLAHFWPLCDYPVRSKFICACFLNGTELLGLSGYWILGWVAYSTRFGHKLTPKIVRSLDWINLRYIDCWSGRQLMPQGWLFCPLFGPFLARETHPKAFLVRRVYVLSAVVRSLPVRPWPLSRPRPPALPISS